MKVAIATTDGGLKSKVSGVFGRAPSFTLVIMENDKVTDEAVIENEFAKSPSGAGIQAAQMLVNEGVNAVIGGNFGPNLANVFNRAGVSMYRFAGGTVEDSIRSLQNGRLQEVSSATGPAHSGMGGGMTGGGMTGERYGAKNGGRVQEKSSMRNARGNIPDNREGMKSERNANSSGIVDSDSGEAREEELNSLYKTINQLEQQISEIKERIDRINNQ